VDPNSLSDQHLQRIGGGPPWAPHSGSTTNQELVRFCKAPRLFVAQCHDRSIFDARRAGTNPASAATDSNSIAAPPSVSGSCAPIPQSRAAIGRAAAEAAGKPMAISANAMAKASRSTAAFDSYSDREAARVVPPIIPIHDAEEQASRSLGDQISGTTRRASRADEEHLLQPDRSWEDKVGGDRRRLPSRGSSIRHAGEIRIRDAHAGSAGANASLL
jgi:hypothetical protein